ncbi:MAG: hypothetical protein J5966_06395 [Lachnospiraceae bacterium]|nr:hypothetical protein [Lachnospiraceae bacterium]
MNTKAKISLVLTEAERERIGKNSTEGKLTIDLHGMKVKEAKRFINNLIAINREKQKITCIHGFNHGTALKGLITGLDNPRIKNRFSPGENPGITVLVIAAA